MPIVLDLTKVDRSRALRTWMAYHGIEAKTLAERLGVHRGTVSRLIKGERNSAHLIDQMAAMGIPRELLPKATGDDNASTLADKNEQHSRRA